MTISVFPKGISMFEYGIFDTKSAINIKYLSKICRIKAIDMPKNGTYESKPKINPKNIDTGTRGRTSMLEKREYIEIFDDISSI